MDLADQELLADLAPDLVEQLGALGTPRGFGASEVRRRVPESAIGRDAVRSDSVSDTTRVLYRPFGHNISGAGASLAGRRG